MRMKRVGVFVAVSVAAAFLACGEDPSSVSAPGTMTFTLAVAEGVTFNVDQIKVTLRQGTKVVHLSQSVSGSGRFELAQQNLDPGPWEVIVRGLVQGEVEFYGRTTATVTAGEEVPVSLTLNTFVPVVSDIATTSSTDFTVIWQSVTDAEQYDVVVSTDPGLSSPYVGQVQVQAGTLSADFTTPGVGTFYVGVSARRSDLDQLSETGKLGINSLNVVTQFVSATDSLDATLSQPDEVQVYSFDAPGNTGIVILAGPTASGTPVDLAVTAGPFNGQRLGGDNNLGPYGDSDFEWIVAVEASSPAPAGGSGELRSEKTVEVTSASGGTGDYTLMIQVCRVFPINIGDTFADALSSTDCLIFNPESFERTHGVIFSFDATGGDEVTIDHSSNNYDATLFLFGPDGALIAGDDDGLVGTDSRLAQVLPSTGTYLIVAAALHAGEVGNFTLTTTSGILGDDIAWVSDRDGNREIYVINVNGTGTTNLTNHPAFDADPAWSWSGGQIAFTSDRDGNDEIFIMDADGTNIVNLTNAPLSNDWQPAWSSDDSRLVFKSDRSGNPDIWVIDADGSNPANLTNDPSTDGQATWSPDGLRIVFESDRDGDFEIFIMNADGSGVTQLTNNGAGDFEPSFTPDGGLIVFITDRDGDSETYTMGPDGSNQGNFSNSPGTDEFSPSVSPDGGNIVHASNRDGPIDVYLVNFDGSNLINLTNNPALDVQPHWAPDGTRSIVIFDLVATSITAPSQTNVLEGEILRVDIVIDNPGPDPVPSGWTGEIRLSADATIDASDLLLATYVEQNDIAAGSNTRSLAVLLPETATPGTYFLGLILDAGDAVTELNEGNNVLAASTQITLSSGVAFSPRLNTSWDHTCRINSSGGAECWGLNLDGQLGDGTTNISSSPVSVQGGLTFMQIVTGLFHTCGLTDTYEAFCWGWNGDGQVGDPGSFGTAVLSPTAVVGGLAFVRLAAGANHTCGIASDGKIWCWGTGADGELGDGQNTGSDQPVQADPAGSIFMFKDVAAGERFTCGIEDNGNAYCWGSNAFGQLGDGTNTNASLPVQLPLGILVQVSAANDHVCFLDESSQLLCVGSNNAGQLGDGTTIDRNTVVIVPGVWQGVRAGGFHTCGVRSDGNMSCWGSNFSGQLGDGTVNDATSPVQVVGPFAAASFATGLRHTCAQTSGSDQCWGDDRYGEIGDGAPVDASQPNAVSTSGISKIVAGWYQSCARTNTNTGLCWGSGTFGEVGDFTNNDINVTLRSVAVAGLVVADITAENAHACASGTGTEARCWGWNGFGQLGDNTLTSANSGVLVVNNAAANYTAIDAGYEHTCALFDSAQVWCWGRNDHGQLGDGTATDARTMVSAGGFVLAMSAGQDHTCIINTGSGIGDGDAECWGRNEFGQVGDASNISRYTRVIVSSRSRRYTSISTGDFHSCAVQSATAGTDGRPEGTGWCWGRNNDGELGNGTFMDANEPVEVSGGMTWSVIDAGNDLTCGITTSGDAYCWGFNNFGQLGDGTYLNSNTPQLVTGGHTFIQIDAGNRHTCAITTSGAPFCWGSNRRGEHGNGTVDNRLTPAIVPPGASSAASGSASVSLGLGLGWRLSGRRFTFDDERAEERPPRRNDP